MCKNIQKWKRACWSVGSSWPQVHTDFQIYKWSQSSQLTLSAGKLQITIPVISWNVWPYTYHSILLGNKQLPIQLWFPGVRPLQERSDRRNLPCGQSPRCGGCFLQFLSLKFSQLFLSRESDLCLCSGLFLQHRTALFVLLLGFSQTKDPKRNMLKLIDLTTN